MSGNIIANPAALNVWSKLSKSNDADVQDYFKNLNSCLMNRPQVFFSDLEEQKKKKLNNQITYKMFYSQDQEKWIIEEFLVPLNIRHAG